MCIRDRQMIQQQGGPLGQSGAPSPGIAMPPPLPGQQPAPSAAGTNPDLMSPAEAAQYLGVSEADVLQTLEAGDLKGKKIGSTWRITRAAIDQFLQS